MNAREDGVMALWNGAIMLEKILKWCRNAKNGVTVLFLHYWTRNNGTTMLKFGTTIPSSKVAHLGKSLFEILFYYFFLNSTSSSLIFFHNTASPFPISLIFLKSLTHIHYILASSLLIYFNLSQNLKILQGFFNFFL